MAIYIYIYKDTTIMVKKTIHTIISKLKIQLKKTFFLVTNILYSQVRNYIKKQKQIVYKS